MGTARPRSAGRRDHANGRLDRDARNGCLARLARPERCARTKVGRCSRCMLRRWGVSTRMAGPGFCPRSRKAWSHGGRLPHQTRRRSIRNGEPGSVVTPKLKGRCSRTIANWQDKAWESELHSSPPPCAIGNLTTPGGKRYEVRRPLCHRNHVVRNRTGLALRWRATVRRKCFLRACSCCWLFRFIQLLVTTKKRRKPGYTKSSMSLSSCRRTARSTAISERTPGRKDSPWKAVCRRYAIPTQKMEDASSHITIPKTS